MSTLRVIYHLARADFYERTRRYSFLVVLGLVIFLGYQVGIGNMGIKLGQYRGEFNSAWVGSMMALMATFFLGWFGFYVINNSIARDRETRVGQIMATTPMTRLLYAIGKWISNFVVLMTMVVILMFAGIVIQLLQGESLQLDLLAFVNPFVVIVLPAIALVAAVAVLFETIPFLSSGFGNIVYFFLFVMVIALAQEASLNPVLEPTGTVITHNYMTAELIQKNPDYDGEFTLGGGFEQEVTNTFLWNGIPWTGEMLLLRSSLLGAALLITMVAALFFDRFDPSRRKPKRMKKSASSSEPVAVSSPQGATVSEPMPTPRLTPLSAATNHFNFSNILSIELKLLLKGQRWWWYLVAGGLIVAGLVNSPETAYKVILPLAWVWPILLWSSIGCRETRHNVQSITFASPFPVWRQLPAQWLAGFIMSIIVASGVLLRLVIAGDFAGLLWSLIGAIFIPSLALACGVWSNGSKLFEILYILFWYLGPINRLPLVDYLGVTGESQPLTFILAAIVLAAFAMFGRTRQLKNG